MSASVERRREDAEVAVLTHGTRGQLANGCLKPCGHEFCATCIKQLKKRAVFLATEGVMCPHCRQPVKEFQLPNEIVPSVSTSKSAWGASAAAAPRPPAPAWGTAAPAPMPLSMAAAPVPRAAPAPQQKKQANGPAGGSAKQAPPLPAAVATAATSAPARKPGPAQAPAAAPAAAAAAPAPAPTLVPVPSSEAHDSFSAFGGGGSEAINTWSAGGTSTSMQMPAPSGAMGGFGSLGGGGGNGWSNTAFSGLPGLDTKSVFAPGGGGLWGGVPRSGPPGGLGTGLDWNSQGGGPTPFDSSSWDSFQMPGGGSGGNIASAFGVGLGFGSLDSNTGGGQSGGSGGIGQSGGGGVGGGGASDPAVGNIEVNVKFNDEGGRSKDLVIRASAEDRSLLIA